MTTNRRYRFIRSKDGVVCAIFDTRTKTEVTRWRQIVGTPLPAAERALETLNSSTSSRR